MSKLIHAPYGANILKTTQKQESPFYFYDLDLLESHLTYMSESLDDDFKLWYACKANPMSAILKVFRNLGFGIDVASQGELDQALRSGVKPNGILSTGPAKSHQYLESLIDYDVRVIVAESINQLKDLDKVSQKFKTQPDVLLRVQLDWNEGTSVLGGDLITPFGIGIDDWKECDFSVFKNINIIGLHAFQWGNLLKLESLDKIWNQTTQRLVNFAKECNISLDVLDLGGGIGIPYHNEQEKLDFKDIHHLLLNIKNKFNLKKIWMELGRYAVGECGYYLAKVIDSKQVRGKKLLVLNGGINHIARPALTKQYFPCDLLRESNADKETYQIHGPLCTALDYLGTFELPSDITIGDWVVFSQTGAYGFTEAMPFFLCHDLPSESIYYKGDYMAPRPPKTSADWMI
jgi:diaminopimelate decarboxylase